MKILRTMALAMTLGLAAPALAGGTGVSQVYVFGDSFVDSGNAYLGTVPFVPPLPAPAADPAQGYFQGRFGDGYNFADIISKRLTGRYADPYLANPLTNTNYAVGGARAAGDYFIPPFPQPVPGLPSQELFYGGQFGAAVDPNGVYLIVFGNNDVNAIQAGDTYGLTPAQYGDLYATNIVNTILALNAGGAGHILLFGVPNPNETEGLTLAGQLAAKLAPVVPTLTSNFTQFDFFDFFGRVQGTPQAYGLTADVDFATPCLAAVTPGPGIDCTGYFSFDGTHVTKPVQFEIAREALSQAGLATVPEPAVWAQLLLGFGLAGLALRRRRPALASAVA